MGAQPVAKPFPTPENVPADTTRLISPEVIANGMPAREPPKYAKIGIDGLMAFHIKGEGYLVMRTHETKGGTVAKVSIITDSEAGDFDDN